MRWLSRLLGRSAFERSMDDEMRYHVDMEARELERGGMSPAGARRAALVAFGGVERFKEEGRDARGVTMLDELRQDAAYAVRAARRAPGFTTVAVLTLALGIGATTAIFSVVRGVLLRDLPFADPGRLVRVWATNPSRSETRSALSLPDLEDWRREGTVPGAAVERLAGFSTLPSGLVLADGGEPVRLRTAFISEDFFATLGVRPLVGRLPTPAEFREGRDRVVVISEGLWRSRFGGDPGIAAGRTVRLNDEPFAVLGVLPAEVRFPGASPEAWTPLSVVPATGIPRVRGNRWVQGLARLRPGATAERARAELSAVARRLEGEYGDSNGGWSGAALLPLHEELVGNVRGRLLVIFGAVVLVLALACVNVANLVLARASSRARELAVRTALGAGRGRLVRQLLTEGVLLALAGGVLGIALAWWGAGALVAVAARWLPPVGDVRPDWLVLGFALALATLTGVGFGLIPATRPLEGIAGTLRESGRGIVSGGGPSINRGPTLRQVLVAAEVGLAVMLVAGAGLLVKSFARLSRVDLGFDAEHTAYAKVTMLNSRYANATTYRPAALRMLEQVRAIPGVAAAAQTKDAPLRGAGESQAFTVPAAPPAAPGERPTASFLPVSPGYFAAMGIPLRAGRDLTEQDGDTAAAGVVASETAARALWPARDPIGEEIVLGAQRLRVVGVVGDVRYEKVDSSARPMFYLPQRLMSRRIITFVARARPGTAPAALVPALRAAIRAVEPDQPITELGTMRDAAVDAVAAPRFLTALVGLFGALALVLAAVGVYGVVAYVVGQRTNEIGVRMALGARPQDIAAWTLRTGLAPVFAGLAVGLAATLALSRLLAAQLYSVSPTDPAVFAAVLAILAAVSLFASAVPAMRAARTEPTVALRE
ncbi:MAG TPA: ABC transporter permease [Gemmatimonadaceae bacterium]|nr:ABC transporter permease [Gemmatimonadaceae bacterium]